MKYNYLGNDYNIRIIRKNNKNTYIRFKDNEIVVTTNYFVSDKNIKKLINDNQVFINKAIDKYSKKELDDGFMLFGKVYDIIYDNKKEVVVDGNMIYTGSEKELNKYLSSYIDNVYSSRLEYWYNSFDERLPNYNLKIRKMKSRWGVCNTRNNNITLNLELSKYDIKYLDYVIIHELAHFIYPNHSKNFWLVVSKYCSNYKDIRKEMKNFII